MDPLLICCVGDQARSRRRRRRRRRRRFSTRTTRSRLEFSIHHRDFSLHPLWVVMVDMSEALTSHNPLRSLQIYGQFIHSLHIISSLCARRSEDGGLVVLSLAALVVLRLYNSSVGTRDRSKIHLATFRGLGWDSLASLLGHCSVGASWGAVAWAQDCRRRLDVDREVDLDAMVNEARSRRSLRNRRRSAAEK